ncbi:EAL domain-containing protein [Solibacillus sp. FSL W7-1472]|uniref:bifunctional diguanylate cyclase/phosphodiesterase n=1 Tax=Solibacillus sp. FSL W7-1472 TaxID=2921707 RepID=UPI0030DD1AF9
MNEFDNLSVSDEGLYDWLCQMARQIDLAVAIINPNKGYTIEFVNQIFTQTTGYREDDVLGSTLSLLQGPLTDMLNENSIQESIENGLTFKTSSFHYRKDGYAFWNEVRHLPMFNQQGILQYCVIIMKDVTDSMNIESLIELEREVYFSLETGHPLENVLRNICKSVEITFGKKCHCSIVLVDENDRMINIYGEMWKDLKELDEKVLLMDMKDKRKINKPLILKDLEQSIYHEAYRPIIDKYRIVSMWSQPILNSEEKTIGLFTMYFEQRAEPKTIEIKFMNRIAPIVTLALKYFDQKSAIHRLAFCDVASGLNNYERFKIILNDFTANQSMGHLYIIEPGEYQNIIDLYDRQGGDEVLRQLANRIQNIPSFADSIIARYTHSAIIVATRLSLREMKIPPIVAEQFLSEPYYIDGKEVYLTLKIGTSSFSSRINYIEAVRQADIALSSALKVTGTVIKNFNMSLIESVEQEMNVLAHFARGLKNSEFFPMLQPKVNLMTGEIESFEALARWNSTDLGVVSPTLFIPVAENTGNIYKVDLEIFKKVLLWQKQRHDAGLKLYQVSINISPSHFYNPAFVESSIALIESYKIDPKFIKFEITESVELENVIRAKKIIDELQQLGIETSIDDFGVGYSSLSYLQELPFKEIKIDKSFVDNLANPRMNAVIKTIIQLSDNLNMVSVAEGIETEEQHLELKRLGCQVGQGYYYYKPMLIEQINELLDQQLKTSFSK